MPVMARSESIVGHDDGGARHVTDADDRRANDRAALPLVTSEGRRMPRDAMPDDEAAPGLAYGAIHDELMIDGNARLNLATFVTTWMATPRTGPCTRARPPARSITRR
jgi:hypothetical protein